MFHVKHTRSINKEKQAVFLETMDFMVSKENFSIVKIENKEYLQTYPIPFDLDSYYKSDEYLSHTDAKNNLFSKAYQGVKKITLWQKLNSIDSLKSNHKKLLDIGAGTADFLSLAQKKDWEVYGVEPNENARNIAASKKIELFDSLENIKDSKFDVITMWHVLEHIPDLDKTINKIKNLLNPNGLLIVAVPNYNCWDAKKYGKYWAAYDVPRHIWHFNRSSMNTLFSEDFKLLKTRPMWFDSFYVCLLSEKYCSGKMNWIKGVVNGFFSNFKAIFSKEYSSITYYYQKD